ncbi:MAG: BirA family biotin operon repressor/biotin-[acetyl-CoA-carboxylase] ligase [Bacteroidia bacterium]|jgi:BirA family biotin operon repressor/biotin-[acetyl-CoA-carboxylase] ligase
MSSNLFVGQHVVRLVEIDSTNNYARELVRDKMPIEGTVVVTTSQTHGRGQRSNSWVSEPGLNLTCSYILKPAFLSAVNQFALSATVALSVYETILVFVQHQEVKIKWPNDILVGGKKIAGILIENTLRKANLDASIIGIGINVNQDDFETELNATSLKTLIKSDLDLEQVLATLSEKLEKNYLKLRCGKDAELLDSLNQSLFGRGDEIELEINGNLELVQIVGTAKNGELELRHSDGRKTSHQHHEIKWNLNP